MRLFLFTHRTESIEVVPLGSFEIRTACMSLTTLFLLNPHFRKIPNLMALFSTTIAICHSHQALTHMFLTIYCTSMFSTWRISTPSLLRPRVRHPILIFLVEIWGNLVGNSLHEHWILLNLKPPLRSASFIRLGPLKLLIIPLESSILNFFCMNY